MTISRLSSAIIYSTAYRLSLLIVYKISYKQSLYFGIPGVSLTPAGKPTQKNKKDVVAL